MTIILTRSYATFAQGATVDLDNSTEAALVAQGRATLLLNQGPNFQPLTANQQQLLQDEFLSDGVVVAQTFTWATLPAPAAYIGTAYVTDVGASGSMWRSDGANWGLVNGSVVLARGNTDLNTTVTTSEEDLISIPIPAGLIGANGQLVVTHFWQMTNSANNKTMRVKLGGTAFFANVQTVALIFLPPPTRIWNRNNQASQIAFAAANGNVTVSTGMAVTTGTVDTAAATTLAISGQKATGAEALGLYAYSVELIRP